MLLVSEHVTCVDLDTPRGPTDHATHSFKLSMRGICLYHGHRVPLGAPVPVASVQRPTASVPCKPCILSSWVI